MSFDRRLAWVNVARSTIENVCTQGAQYAIVAGVPPGARVVRIVVSDEGESVRILFHHETFAVVGPGDPIPDITLAGEPIP